MGTKWIDMCNGVLSRRFMAVNCDFLLLLLCWYLNQLCWRESETR